MYSLYFMCKYFNAGVFVYHLCDSQRSKDGFKYTRTNDTDGIMIRIICE